MSAVLDGLGRGDRAQAVVALGGGHGLHASLTALRRLVDDLTVDDLTAIVTVADNGGSSGRLRGEFNVLPPGDLRMALAALCGDDEWGDTWARVLQHRFEGEGEMRGHVVGNLLIVGPLGAARRPRRRPRLGGPAPRGQGPRAADGADPHGHHRRGARARPPTREATTTVRGQVEVATTDGVIVSIDLEPPDPPVSAEALAKIAEADWAFLGPGSWFSSVLPHLRVPALREAIIAHRRAAGRGPQPRGAGGGDRWVRPGRPPARPARPRAGPAGPHRAGRPVELRRRPPRRAPLGGRRLPAPPSCSPTSPPTTAPLATTRASWPRPTPGSCPGR